MMSVVKGVHTSTTDCIIQLRTSKTMWFDLTALNSELVDIIMNGSLPPHPHTHTHTHTPVGQR